MTFQVKLFLQDIPEQVHTKTYPKAIDISKSKKVSKNYQRSYPLIPTK